jgi:hypothetical protein
MRPAVVVGGVLLAALAVAALPVSPTPPPAPPTPALDRLPYTLELAPGWRRATDTRFMRDNLERIDRAQVPILTIDTAPRELLATDLLRRHLSTSHRNVRVDGWVQIGAWTEPELHADTLFGAIWAASASRGNRVWLFELNAGYREIQHYRLEWQSMLTSFRVN